MQRCLYYMPSGNNTCKHIEAYGGVWFWGYILNAIMIGMVFSTHVRRVLWIHMLIN